MRNWILAALAFAIVGIATPASAGGPCGTNCTREMRPDVVHVAKKSSSIVERELCISTKSWNALKAYWRKKNGNTRGCHWGAESTDHTHLTSPIHGPCGTVSVKRGKVYGYDSRTGTPHRWGPF